MQFERDMDCGICMDSLAAERRSDSNSNRRAGDAVCTKCGHTFHRGCLRRWLQADDRPDGTCPTCRVPCDDSQLRQIYITTSSTSRPSSRRTGQCRQCLASRAGKIWCPWHRKCWDRCRTAAAGIIWLTAEPNGLLYCQNCCTVLCTFCGRRIANTSVRVSGTRFCHAGCFPCRACRRPLHSGGYDLHLKTNHFHATCLRCMRCGRMLHAGACRFRGMRPICIECCQYM